MAELPSITCFTEEGNVSFSGQACSPACCFYKIEHIEEESRGRDLERERPNSSLVNELKSSTESRCSSLLLDSETSASTRELPRKKQHSKKQETMEGVSSNSCTMSTLPDGVLLEIFGKLSCNTLINIAPVCKRWSVLTKHRSLWQREDALYEKYQLPRFLRIMRAAWHLRSLDLSGMHAESGEVLEAVMYGPVSVKRFSCFSSAEPKVIIHMLERYKDSLEELNIVLSDERISYGEGGTFKDGVEPRPGHLLSIIGNMEKLRVLRFTGCMPSVALYQGRVNPKWYFGELENPKLQVLALSIKFENPSRVLVEKFVIPFLRSKQNCIKELQLTADLWKFKEIQDVVKDFTKLEAILRLPIERISVLHWIRKNIFVDLILAGWIDYSKVMLELIGHRGLCRVEELSLRFCDRLYSTNEEPTSDFRLESFLPALGQKLVSLKRLHVYRWDAPPPFVESVHSTAALRNLLRSVKSSLEELHVSDAFRGGRNLPQLMKAVRESAPHLTLTRSVFVNSLGNKGYLFSVHGVKSKIPNSHEFKLESGKSELGVP